MNTVALRTIQELESYASRVDHVLVSYSGGKDSRAIMDLCCKTFKRVSGYLLYLAPGLRIDQEQIDYAKSRWGVEVITRPGQGMAQGLKVGFYSDPSHEYDGIPVLSCNQVGVALMDELGIRLCVNGAKFSDYTNRRQQIAGQTRDDIIYPLREWNKWAVIDYLTANHIPVPESHNGVSSGVSLKTSSLLWLAKHYPDDFKRLERVFPYIGVTLKRQEWFGVGPKKQRAGGTRLTGA